MLKSDNITPQDVDLILVVIEFLESIFHTILYVYSIYPKKFFKKYKTDYLHQQCFICESKLVRNYIRECVMSLKMYLEQGKIEKILFQVLTKNQSLLLKEFIFQFKFLNQPSSDVSKFSHEEFSQLYIQMRNFFIELHTLEIENSEELTFNVRLCCKDVSVTDLDEHLDWKVFGEENNLDTSMIIGGANNTSYELRPIQRFSTKSMIMQLLLKQEVKE